MCLLYVGRAMLRLCSLPPSPAGAAKLLSCRNRSVLNQAAPRCSGGDGGEGAPELAGAPVLARHRRAWGRSLSPLERISSMIPPELISREVQELQSEGGDPKLPPLSSTPGYTCHGEPEDGGVICTPRVSSSTPGYTCHGEPEDGGAIGTPRLSSSTPGYTSHGEPEDGGAISTPWPSSSTPSYTCHGQSGNGVVIRTPQMSSSANGDISPGELDHGGITGTTQPPSSSTSGYTSHGEPEDGGVICTLQLSTSTKGYTFHGEPGYGPPIQDKCFRVFSEPKPPSFLPGNTSHGKAADGGVLSAPLQSKEYKDTSSTHEPPSALPGYATHAEAGDAVVLVPLQGKGYTETTLTPQPPSSPLSAKERVSLPQTPSSPLVSDTPEVGNPSPPLGRPFTPGDLLLAEYKRKHYSMFNKMFVLKEYGKLTSNWGAIRNQDILGKLPGQQLRTSTGHEFLLRRPTLEDYVKYMKRGPNISYPKDMAAMMTMMDVSPGDVVLEAGSGSGAFSLFLSRAVGSEGGVYSFEVRADHHEIAKRNFVMWRKAWQIRSGRSWPDNVNFINRSILDAPPDITSVAFDAAVLDMLHPQVALPVVTGNLKQGAVCAVYIANITQVIDLLEGIRSCQLPLLCERVMEVAVTEWLVAPSRRKDGSVSQRVDPLALDQLTNDDEETDTEDDEPPAFGQLPYIARPLPWQTGHTAFLVYLRKFKSAPPTEPEDSS